MPNAAGKHLASMSDNRRLNAREDLHFCVQTKHLMQSTDLALLIAADKGLEFMCVKTRTIDLLIAADMTLAFLQLENNKLNIRG
jgi:hypothetical protein